MNDTAVFVEDAGYSFTQANFIKAYDIKAEKNQGQMM